MKKIMLYSFLAISIISCKNENDKNAVDSKTETEQISFYKNLLIDETYDDLKKEYSKEFLNFPDSVIKKIAKIQLENSRSETNINDTIFIDSGEIAFKEQLAKVDSLYYNKKDLSKDLYSLFLDENGAQLKTIESFENNIIALFWSPMQNASSSHYQKLLLKDNDVLDLGNGLKKLSKIEFENLENFLKSKGFKDIEIDTEPNRNDVGISKSNNYLLQFKIYDKEDADCCPSINVSFETADFITIIQNTIKVVKE